MNSVAIKNKGKEIAMEFVPAQFAQKGKITQINSDKKFKKYFSQNKNQRPE
jgi:hypothetical protein